MDVLILSKAFQSRPDLVDKYALKFGRDRKSLQRQKEDSINRIKYSQKRTYKQVSSEYLVAEKIESKSELEKFIHRPFMKQLLSNKITGCTYLKQKGLLEYEVFAMPHFNDVHYEALVRSCTRLRSSSTPHHAGPQSFLWRHCRPLAGGAKNPQDDCSGIRSSCKQCCG